MRIVIQGEPIAQKRPRFVRRGKFVGAYNSQETEAGRWLLEARGQITHKSEGPLKVVIAAFFKRPLNHYGTGKNSKVFKPSAPLNCTCKKDIDNIVKFVLDCLNGEAWVDDKQVVELFAGKYWAYDTDIAKTVVEIHEI